MGAIVTSFEDETKQLRKVLISTFGGFLYDEKTKRYYEIPGDSRDHWINYLYSKLAELSSKN